MKFSSVFISALLQSGFAFSEQAINHPLSHKTLSEVKTQVLLGEKRKDDHFLRPNTAAIDTLLSENKNNLKSLERSLYGGGGGGKAGGDAALIFLSAN